MKFSDKLKKLRQEHNLMIDIVDAVTEFLHENNLDISPDQRRELIKHFYGQNCHDVIPFIAGIIIGIIGIICIIFFTPFCAVLRRFVLFCIILFLFVIFFLTMVLQYVIILTQITKSKGVRKNEISNNRNHNNHCLCVLVSRGGCARHADNTRRMCGVLDTPHRVVGKRTNNQQNSQ